MFAELSDQQQLNEVKLIDSPLVDFCIETAFPCVEGK
jgi:hypothetical protein